MKMRMCAAVWLMVTACCLVSAGCKKSKPAAKIDTHSPEAVNVALQQQQQVLKEAFSTNDLLFIHNQMYYIGTFVDALSRKVTGEKKTRVDAILAELKGITHEIDNAAGRQHREATEASLERFYAVLKELDAEFKPQSEGVKR